MSPTARLTLARPHQLDWDDWKMRKRGWQFAGVAVIPSKTHPHVLLQYLKGSMQLLLHLLVLTNYECVVTCGHML